MGHYTLLKTLLAFFKSISHFCCLLYFSCHIRFPVYFAFDLSLCALKLLCPIQPMRDQGKEYFRIFVITLKIRYDMEYICFIP